MGRGWTVQGHPGRFAAERTLAVDRLADDVEEASEHFLADRNLDRTAAITLPVRTAPQAVSRIHRYTAHRVLTQVLLYFENQALLAWAVFCDHLEGVVDGRQFLPGEIDINDGRR